MKQLELGSLWNLEVCLVSWLEMHFWKQINGRALSTISLTLPILTAPDLYFQTDYSYMYPGYVGITYCIRYHYIQGPAQFHRIVWENVWIVTNPSLQWNCTDNTYAENNKDLLFSYCTGWIKQNHTFIFTKLTSPFGLRFIKKTRSKFWLYLLKTRSFLNAVNFTPSHLDTCIHRSG